MRTETTVDQEGVDHATDESSDDENDERTRLVDQVIDECTCDELDDGFPCARCYIAERETFTGEFAR